MTLLGIADADADADSIALIGGCIHSGGFVVSFDPEAQTFKNVGHDIILYTKSRRHKNMSRLLVNKP